MINGQEVEAAMPEKALRRAITSKWGVIAFGSAFAMMVIVSVANVFLAPSFHAAINMRPSKLRQSTISLRWTNVAMVFWTLLILYMSLAETKHRLDWVVKRLGRLSVALMPPMYLLTLRPSPLPHTFYLQVLPMHKWLSRVVVTVALAHGVGYTYKYYRDGMLVVLKKPDNVAGIAALLLFLLMGLTAWSWFRRRSYQIFYGFHYFSAWICLPLIKYHSRPPCDYYMSMCLALLVWQAAYRIFRSGRVKLRAQFVSNTLILVDIPKTSLPGWMWKWSPGAHIRLSTPLWDPLTWFRSSHPYTIASLPDEPTMKLVIRKTNFKIQMRRDYSISGPHRTLPPYMENQVTGRMVRRALFVIGGSGIAFGAPVMRWMLLHGVEVKMLWAIRNPYDAKVLQSLGLHDYMCDGTIEVYYTGDRLLLQNEDDDEDEDQDLSVDISDNCCMEDSDGRHQNNGRRVRKDDLLKNYAANMYNCRPHLNLRLKSWLYSLDTSTNDCCCADRLINVCEEDRLGAWVISTGAPKLVQDARQWAYNAGVCFFEEEFTL